MRVSLLSNIVPPYRLPVFRALADTPGWQLRVFANASTEFDRGWQVDAGGLDLEITASVALRRGDRTLHLPWGLPAALRRFAPDVVVSGELGPRSLLAALHCRAAGIPLVAWSYQTPLRAAEAGALREKLGRLLLRRAAAVVGMGSEAHRALRAWGVADAQIFDAPNAHDVEGFRKILAPLDVAAARRDLHAGLGTRPRVALVAGRLFPIKGIGPLLEAWDRLPAALRGDWSLLCVGDGPLAGQLARARASHAPGEIVHVPAVQPRDMAELYAAADLLVFPSLGDVWGLAVNEAMACGLPVLCSTRAGCAPDLVVPGGNGWLADPLDSAAFARALEAALRCEERPQLGERARETVARFTPEAMAEGFRQAVRYALSHRPV